METESRPHASTLDVRNDRLCGALDRLTPARERVQLPPTKSS